MVICLMLCYFDLDDSISSFYLAMDEIFNLLNDIIDLNILEKEKTKRKKNEWIAKVGF